jgi:hypothetical protein
MERHGGDDDDDASLGITPDSSTRALWQYYQQRRLRQVGEMDEGMRICLSVSEIPQGIFNKP